MIDQLFKASWIEKRPWRAFFIASVYSFISFFSAIIIFPSFAGIASVGLLSVLLVPSINYLLTLEEKQEVREKKLNLKQLFKDHRDVLETYFYLFIGIMVSYALITLFLGFDSKTVFKEQLSVVNVKGLAYENIDHYKFFKQVFLNNLSVLVVFLFLSLVYGAGSLMFLSWNASAWGVVFGFFAFQSAITRGVNPLKTFLLLMLRVTPHTVLEALAYLMVAFAGGVIGKAVLREELFSDRFKHVLTDGVIITLLAIIPLTLAAIIETIV